MFLFTSLHAETKLESRTNLTASLFPLQVSISAEHQEFFIFLQRLVSPVLEAYSGAAIFIHSLSQPTSESDYTQRLFRYLLTRTERGVAVYGSYTIISNANLSMVGALIVSFGLNDSRRWQIQAGIMRFLHWVACCTIRDKVRSSVTQEELGLEPLLLRIERNQLWRHLPGEVFQACSTGRRPRGRPRSCWRDCVSWLAWEHLGSRRMRCEGPEKSGRLY